MTPLFVQPRKAKPCSYYQMGNCRFSDEECDFLHVTSDITIPSPHLRGKSCRFHLAGHCRNGDACRFKHSDNRAHQDDTTSSSLDNDDGGEWNQVHHHHPYHHPLSPTGFRPGVLLSPIYAPSIPFPIVNVKDGAMYPHSPLWTPPPASYDGYPYELPSSPSAVPISPYHYQEEMYFYPFSPVYAHAHPYYAPPHSHSALTPALLSPTRSFDSATSPTSTPTSTDQWFTPRSTRNSFSADSVSSVEEVDDYYYNTATSQEDKDSTNGKEGEERLQRHQPTSSTSISSRPEPKLVIPWDVPVTPAPSPVEVFSPASLTPISIAKSLGSSSTPKCQSPDSRPRSKKEFHRLTKYKTKPCKHWKVNGTCPHGDDCTFIHNEKKLVSSKSQSQVSPVSTTSNGSAESCGSKPESLPEKPLTELEEKRRRGFFPISWRVIGGGVLMGKPSKPKETSSPKTVPSSEEQKVPATIDTSSTSPTLVVFPSIEDSSRDSDDYVAAELTFDSIMDQAPKSATIVLERKKADVRQSDVNENGPSQRARATSIPSTPRAATFLGGAQLSLPETSDNPNSI
ncbi:hypothetical protein D9758_013435 [Tetrapyrgos nigripes]|uniref:C3H1-type domain-containing protein n=1 Tax=Tetrapyrgos nigripes TaxID=182062 RepID=A0A8H5CL20_9AGAR|nr:hypothetical protein D9758_013435 [Tetrapyrgos nigripes]